MNHSVRSLLPSLLLIGIYFIADEFFGTVTGVWVAFLLGGAEFIYTRIREKVYDKMILLTTLFFCIPGLISIWANGSGFGYYSLSSIFITEYRGAELGTIALTTNIIREIITLLGAAVLVRCFGKLAPICSGGATTMDTTLPVITRFSGKEYVIIAIFHGFVVDFSVPFLVTFFAKL